MKAVSVQNKLVLPLSVVFLFLLLSFLLYSDFRLGDDTYIYLQYVRNIINGDGIAFNAGERSYGFTSVVWLLLLVVIQLVLHNFVTTSIIASLLLSVVLILMIWKYSYSDSLNRAVAAVAMFLAALDPNVLKHSYIGMEAPLSGLLIFLAVMLHRKELNNKESFQWSSVVCGLACLNRPESFLLVLMLLTDKILKKETLKQILRWVFWFLIPILLWSGFAYYYFGSFIPNTVVAKGGAYPPFSLFWKNILETFQILFTSYGVLCITLTGHLLYKFKTNKNDALIWLKEYWIFYLFPLLLILSYCVLVSNEIIYARYFYVFIPLLLYLTSKVLADIAATIKQKLAIVSYSLIIVQFLAASMLMSYGLSKTYYPSEKVRDEYITWINENTPHNASVAIAAIGKPAFVTNRKIICMMGLINPEIVPYKKDKRIVEYFRTAKPDYIILETTSPEQLTEYLTFPGARVVAKFEKINLFLLRQWLNPSYQKSKLFVNIIAIDWKKE